MDDTEWTQTLGAGPLLLIAAAAIVLILVLVIRFRLHAFLTLIVVSLVTALATGIPTGLIVPTLIDGFGGTLGTVELACRSWSPTRSPTGAPPPTSRPGRPARSVGWESSGSASASCRDCSGK